MTISKERMAKFIAYEGFIRRAAELDLPFMLKGSYVTRQYFQNPEDRIPNDLDWSYLNHLPYKDDATKAFDEWMILITEQYHKDGVYFKNFRENPFWRLMDYALDDDFPTVNTDLDCEVDGQAIYPCGIDISFNLPIDVAPVPLLYKPLRGKPFTIPFTVPLALQVSWKLHQTLVRARFKDLFDLMHLVAHPSFTPAVLQDTMQALVNECGLDDTDPRRLRYVLTGEWNELFDLPGEKSQWDRWRHEITGKFSSALPDILIDTASKITNAAQLPKELSLFKEQFMQAFTKAGFNEVDLGALPEPVYMKMTFPEHLVTPAAPVETTIPVVSEVKTKKGWLDMFRGWFK